MQDTQSRLYKVASTNIACYFRGGKIMNMDIYVDFNEEILNNVPTYVNLHNFDFNIIHLNR